MFLNNFLSKPMEPSADGRRRSSFLEKTNENLVNIIKACIECEKNPELKSLMKILMKLTEKRT